MRNEEDVLCRVWERRLQQICGVLPHETHIRLIRVRYCGRIEQRGLDPIRDHELDHTRQQQALELEAALVICIRKDEEGVLNEGKIVLLGERCGCGLVCGNEVVDEFNAHFE